MKFLVALIAFGGGESAEAQSLLSSNDARGLIEGVSVAIHDEVTGNCLTNVSAIQTEVEYIFETAGIPVLSEAEPHCSISEPCIDIIYWGGRFDGLCVVSARAIAGYFTISNFDQDHSVVNRAYFDISSNGMANSVNADESALANARAFAQEFSTSVIRARRDLE